MSSTHQVTNQAMELADYNMFASDSALVELIRIYGAGWAQERLNAFGLFTGSAHAIRLAEQANYHDPILHTHDRFGHRIDRVDFHPAYHELMKASVEAGVHNLPWREPQAGGHVARAALMYLAFQNEAGHCCPMSMTYSAVPALRKQPDLNATIEPLITASSYDSRFVPFGTKSGLTVGMGMTEKQGGSDVRANTSRARPLGRAGAGQTYALTGHKWFCSAPMSDLFLVLAQAEKGLSCFLVPRFKPDGQKNNIFIQRLKDKLGNKSNASSEIEFVDAFGWLVGDEGRGVPTIIEMVNHTRLDCLLGATALMRQATRQAVHHSKHRSAFGRLLSEQPLMTNVLADLAIETEAALQLSLRVARSYDTHTSSESEALFRRLGSAVAKYWVCKRAPMQVAEALECLGGNGYVESGPMPRLFRESPLLGIWEGSGNVISLDVLRAIGKEPDSLEAVLAEAAKAKGVSRAFDRAFNSLGKEVLSLKRSISKPSQLKSGVPEFTARRFVEKLAICLQAALLVQNSPQAVSDAFIASRLGQKGGLAFGTLPKASLAGAKKIIERAHGGLI